MAAVGAARLAQAGALLRVRSISRTESRRHVMAALTMIKANPVTRAAIRMIEGM
jgi:hypothetical protein